MRLMAVLLCLSPCAGAIEAQEQPARWVLGVKAGVSPYDLEETGTAFVLGPQADLVISSTLLAELSLPLFDHLKEVDAAGIEASERTRFLLPELSLQARLSIGRLRPYLFAGGGAALRLNGPVDGGGTLHAGLGTRVVVGQRTQLRFEGRARSIRPWTGETLDLTVGIEWARN